MRPQDLGIGMLFERIRDAAIVADAKSQRIVFWNQEATNIFGYSVSEVLGLHIEALVPEYLKDQHRVGIARYAETGHGPYIDPPSAAPDKWVVNDYPAHYETTNLRASFE